MKFWGSRSEKRFRLGLCRATRILNRIIEFPWRTTMASRSVGQCFVQELLSEPDAQELLGQLLADLIPDEPKELPQPLNSGFQTVVPR